MEFIDSTGHIFSLDDYNSYPNGYEYNENQYIFWMENEYNSKLSVNCFYIKPIRIIYDGKLTNRDKIHISIKNSSNYSLLSSSKIQEIIESDSNFFNENKYINLDENKHFTKDLYNYSSLNETKNDLLLINNLIKDVYYRVDDNFNEYIYYGNVFEEKNVDGSILYYAKFFSYEYNNETIIVEDSENIIKDDNGKFYINIENNLIECFESNIELKRKNNSKSDVMTLIPFYVVSNVKEEGSWLTNILININDSKYCPITVGGTYYDEIEELVINGRNMGINLPKDIVRSFYNTGFHNDVIDMNVWNSKIKEYLINYMKLRGETGNFRNILNTLQWFGYGDKISINKLLKTDNNFINQYINDNFNIYNDIIQSYKLFKNTTYITLALDGIIESDELNKYNFNEEFWGEGKPKTQDLFNTYISERIDETNIEYVRQYYNYGFNELALKLACLRYYFEKYFLPIHIKIYRASINNQCFMSDIKMLSNISTHINSNSIYNSDNNIIVSFPVQNTLWLSSQIHYIDDNFNEFTDYFNKNSLSNNIYYVNDICFSIPIEFSSKNGEQFYNIHAILYRNDEEILETSFKFCNDTKFVYDNEIINNITDINVKYDMSSNTMKYYTIDNNSKVIELKRINNSKSDFKSIVIYPKLISETYNTYDWLNSKYYLVLLVNNIWYKYEFNIKMPELNINIGTLKYEYNHLLHKQFNGKKDNKLQFNSNIYEPDIVTINNTSFIDTLIKYMRYNCLDYINDDFSILRDNIYYYYYNRNNYKCIYNAKFNENTFELKECYILTSDPSYQKNNVSTNMFNTYKLYDVMNYDNDNDIYSEERNEFLTKYLNNECYISLAKSIISFTDLYKESYNLPNNLSNLLNRVHIFNIIALDNNENNIKTYIKYDAKDYSFNSILSLNIEDENGNCKTIYIGDNDSENIINVYEHFFDIDNGEWNCELHYNDDNNWISDNYLKQHYDFYLMHDNEYWYGVMISKMPIKNSESLFIPNNIYKSIYNGNEYYLEYLRSDNKFLINRLKFINANGINKFSNNEVIVCKVENENTPFNLNLGSKWSIKPLSIGINNFADITSNTNTGIISIGDNLKYERGYYEVQVNYALDNRNMESEKRTTKILIS
jgi:hypothetical protein